MKSIPFLLIMFFFVFNLTLYAESTIRIEFQSDLHIDSIRIENMDNQTTHTLMGINGLDIFFGSPVAVNNPTIVSEDLHVFPSVDRNEMQIRFSLDSPGQVNCEVFDLHGRRKSSLSRLLDSGVHRFTFIPDARGIYMVRVTTATSTRTAKFISYGALSLPKLFYEGVSTACEVRKLTKGQSSTYDYMPLVINQNDLLHINCYSGAKAQTIYDYASSNKNYTLRFTDRYHQFQLFNIGVSKPGIIDVMFAINDSSNRGVDDLNTLDFVVKEDGANISASESFRHVQRMNQVHSLIKTVLLIDNSTSIVNDLSTVKTAALQFVKKVRPNQEIAVYVFSDKPVLLQDFTSDILKLQKAITSITLGYSTTNIYGSIFAALSRWNDQFALNQLTQGSLIVFTAGKDTQGSSTLQTVLNARGTKRVYMIGLGNEITPSVLNQISYPSECIFIQQADELEETFYQIQADIVRYSNSFYWLNYMSPKRTGTHSFAISTADNTNLSATGSVTGSFSANGFTSVNSGVYVNISDDNLYGIDSVFYFFDGIRFNFKTSRDGVIVSRDSLVLNPTTYCAYKQAQYKWSLGNNQHFTLESSNYKSMKLKCVPGDTIANILTINDLANNYAKQLVMINLDNRVPYVLPEKLLSAPPDFTDEMDDIKGWIPLGVELRKDNNDFYSGETSMKIISTSDSNKNFYRPITLSDSSFNKIRIAVKITSELSTFSSVQLVLSNKDHTKVYVQYYDVADNHFIKDKWVVLGGKPWIEVGNPTYKDITQFRVAIFSGTSNFRANFDMLQFGIHMYPAVLITFDDGRASDYSIAFKEMKKRNMVGTSYINSDFIGTDDYMTEEQIIEMNNYGWDIGNHTAAHTDLRTLSTPEEVASAWQKCKDYLDSIGLTRASSHCAYPFNRVNDNVFAGTELFMYKTGRITSAVNPTLFENSRWPIEINCMSVANGKLDEGISFIQNALINGRVPIILFHRLRPDGSSENGLDGSVFIETLNYIQNNGLKTITIDELYRIADSKIIIGHD